jgi:hypothetical protein
MFSRAAAVYDDGSGAALYVGGEARHMDGEPLWNQGLGRWNGKTWESVGEGLPAGAKVYCLTVFDDGAGPTLYVGGRIETAGGVTVSGLARWDGKGWSTVGGGLKAPYDLQSVRALAVYDDGSGPALYAAGTFDSAGGIPANGIAKWNGTGWAPLAEGLQGNPGFAPDALGGHSLIVLDFDDSGPERAKLYVGGVFTHAGGLPANGLAAWDGSSWEPLGVMMPGPGPSLSTTALAARLEPPMLCATALFDDPQHPFLRPFILGYDGKNWTTLGGEFGFDHGSNPRVKTLATWDDGTGEALYAGGDFDLIGDVQAPYLAKWDGKTWSPAGGGFDWVVRGLLPYHDDSGSRLLAVGDFFRADPAGQGLWSPHIVGWDGRVWAGFQIGMQGPPQAFITFDDGSGPIVFAGGYMETAGEAAAPVWGFARWNGSDWMPAVDKKGRLWNGGILDMTVADLGDGPALYAVGDFRLASEKPAAGIARWDGAGWHSLGGPLGNNPPGFVAIAAATAFSDKSGPGLYVAGRFDVDGAHTGVARFDGLAWSVVGWTPQHALNDLLVFDDGSGPALYLCGNFIPGLGNDIPCRGISRWDGTAWSQLGDGLAESLEEDPGQPWVLSMTTWDDGSGAKLYACGLFTYADGVEVNGLASWDGQHWRAVSPRTKWGTNLTTLYDSMSTKLYMRGYIPQADGEPVWGIGRWDGTSWDLIGKPSMGGGGVTTIVGLADEHEPALFVGGDFLQMNGVESGFDAVWRPCPCVADCDGSKVLDLGDFDCFQLKFGTGDPGADCDGSGSLDLFDFLCFVNAFNAGC